MYCNKCGKEVPEGSAFCPACGAAVPTVSAPAAPAAEPVEEAPVYEVPSEPVSGAPAPARVVPAAPPTAPEKPKKKSKKPFIAVIAIILVAVAGFAAWRLLAAEPAHVAEQDQSGTAETVYEDFEVGDVRVLTDGDLGPRLEVTVTNNTGELVTDVTYQATGDLAITDEYGDEGTVSDELSLTCWNPAYSWFGSRICIAYLQPGENTVTLLPSNVSGVVASYTPETGDTQEFQLDEVENIEFEIQDADTLANGTQLLTPEECGVEIELAPDGSITGSITNNTDARWRSAKVYLRAENADGTPATAEFGNGSTSDAFGIGSLEAEYVRPGDTVDLEMNWGTGIRDPARVVATYVVIEEDV